MDPSYILLTQAPMPRAVQEAFALDGHREEIACREDLDPTVWWQLARARPALSGAAMATLVRRELDDEQITWVFANERRTGPLESMIARNRGRITPEHIAAASKLPAGAAERLSAISHLDEDLRLSLAARAGKGAPALMLARAIIPGRVDERVLSMLLDAAAWWPTRPNRRINSAVAMLVELSEGVADGLLDDVAAIPRPLLTIMASSHRLHGPAVEQLAQRIAALPGTDDGAGYAAMAFVANPKVPVEAAQVAAAAHPQAARTLVGRCDRRGSRHIDGPVGSCNDVDLLQWAAYRALPSQYRTEGKVWYLPEVVAAPAYADLGDRLHRQVTGWDLHLPNAVAVEVATRLGTQVDTTVELWPDPSDWIAAQRNDGPAPDPEAEPEVDLSTLGLSALGNGRLSHRRAVLAAVAERLGEDPGAWRTFLAFADGSTMTLASLLAMVEATQ